MDGLDWIGYTLFFLFIEPSEINEERKKERKKRKETCMTGWIRRPLEIIVHIIFAFSSRCRIRTCFAMRTINLQMRYVLMSMELGSH